MKSSEKITFILGSLNTVYDFLISFKEMKRTRMSMATVREYEKVLQQVRLLISYFEDLEIEKQIGETE